MGRCVQDVMTRDVITVPRMAGFKQMVELLAAHRISALPVVDERGALAGIVSETDLVLRQEYPRRYLGGPLPDRARVRAERLKVAATTAADLMTTPVVTVYPEATVADAARLLHDKGLKRVPVVDRGGRVVGMVSRLNLLSVFLRSDDELLHDVLDELFKAPLGIRPSSVQIGVKDGCVTVDGRVERRTLVPEVTRVAQAVDGVVAVDNRLTFTFDDIQARRVDAPWPTTGM